MSDWQPIETAPREMGAQILAYVPKTGDWGYPFGVVVAKWTGEYTEWAMPGICGLSPTHWMPLPEEPR
jgi:hypothetical protein